VNGRKSLFAAVVTLSMGVWSASEAGAQVCIGFPTARGQLAAALVANFPTGGNEFGAEVGYHTSPGVAFFGGINFFDPDAGERATSFGGGAAFSLPEWRALLPTGLYACPAASVVVTTGDGDNAVSVPLGFGFGTILPLGETMTLSPYVVPQLRWLSIGDDSSTDFLLSGGAIVMGFLGPRVYAGATVNRLFVDGSRSVLGLKAGLTF
jgi:hypothetical protein